MVAGSPRAAGKPYAYEEGSEVTGQSAEVAQASPSSPKGLTNLGAGAKVAVMQGLPEQQYLTRTGAPAGQVRVEQTPDVLLQAVAAGRADWRGSTSPPGSPWTGQELLAAFSAELTKPQQSGEWLPGNCAPADA